MRLTERTWKRSNHSITEPVPLIRLPKVKLEISKKGFFFHGAKCFNELPTYVRASENFAQFSKYFDTVYLILPTLPSFFIPTPSLLAWIKKEGSY